MTKKLQLFFRPHAANHTKHRLFLHLVLLVFFAGQSALYAVNPAPEKRVSINMEGGTLVHLFEEIREQTSYNFLYNQEKVTGLDDININEDDATVEAVLDEVLKDTPYEYRITGNIIVIRDAQRVQDQNQSVIRTIVGVVTDAQSGETLPGVSVRAKNSVLGTVTDVDGNFSMQQLPHVKVLIFSYIGYENFELKIDERTEYKIELTQQVELIDDVVVTGYQVINKNELTSAITSIKAEELEKIAPLTVDQMLEGKATGLMITTLSSTPGAASKVRIRGSGTFTGNQEPLWVVDGVIYEDPVPLSADEINSFDNINLIGNAITGINPQDIESINVLKDASATALYGTRAANGVIVITTKRGKVGKPSLNYSGGFSYTAAPTYSDFNLMNSKQRIDVSRELYQQNLGYPSEILSGNGNYSYGYEGALQRLWDETYTFSQFKESVSSLETLNADWFDALYQPAISQKHSVSVSGGAPNVRYYISLGYDDSQGTEKGVGVQRITARSNLDIDLSEKLLLSFNMSGSVTESDYNHSSINLFNEAYYTSRAVPVLNADGSYAYQVQRLATGVEDTDGDGAVNDIYGNYHVLNELENSDRNITNKDLNLSASLRWNITRGLRFTTQASYRNTTNLTEEWIGENTFFIAKLRTYDDFSDMQQSLVNSSATVPFGGIYSGGYTTQKAYNLRNQLNYSKVLAEKHVFNLNLGQETRSVNYLGASGWQVPGYNHAQGRSFISLPTVSSGTEGKIAEGYMNMITWMTQNDGSIYPNITDRLSNSISGFGVFTYSFDNRYIVNFNMRSDGSNTFGQYEKYKFRPAWSTSARWNVHKESFFGNSGILDEFALRASYGFRGTMPNGSPYLTISKFGRLSATFYPESVSSLSNFPNANLSWETTKTTNLGLNYSFFKGRINGAVDYAYSLSEGLLLSTPVSLVNGQGTQTYNGGSKEVRSFEVSLNTVNIKAKNFRWSTNANLSLERDRVIEGISNDLTSTNTISNYLGGTIYASNFPSSGFFSYQFDGLDANGLPTFKNLVADDDQTIAEHLEQVLVYEGTRLPKYYGGFGTRVSYKNLSLSANFSYKLGYKVRLLSLYNGSQNMPMPYENMSAEFLNRWRQSGDENSTNIPGLSSYYLDLESYDALGVIQASNISYIAPSGVSGWYLYDNSNARTVRGDHIRWQSLTMSYNIPKKMTSRLGISNARVALQGSNLAVWAFDKNLKGQDPEQVQGVGMPALPTYSFNINIGF